MLPKTGLSFLLLASVLAFAPAAGGDPPPDAKSGRLPPPPILPPVPPGWDVEHVAFALGNSGKVVGGPARWAVGGGLPYHVQPADQVGRTYMGQSGDRMYFSDQRRHIWIAENGEVWPIVGNDDLGEVDGPAPYARLIYTQSYGGGHKGMVASGDTVYVLDHGWLRRIQRQEDGTWRVDTVAGKGDPKFSVRPGMTCKLSELPSLGKGLTMDTKGNLYFTLNGGLAKADPQGVVSWVITQEKAAQDLAALYAKKWPDVKPPSVSLGSGEGVTLVYHPSGDIFGGGRTWPEAWKVTANGAFVPLAAYAPKEKIGSKRWGPGDPAYYQPHCPMTFSVSFEGWAMIQNEIPGAISRYEPDKVTVLKNDGTWGLIPPDSTDFFGTQVTDRTISMDGATWGRVPKPYPSASMLVRIRKKVTQ